MGENPEQSKQTDFFPKLEPVEDQKDIEKNRIQEEAEKQAEEVARKKHRAISRPHKIEDPLPGVKLGSRDQKYHWD